MTRSTARLAVFLGLAATLPVVPGCSSAPVAPRGDGRGLGARLSDRFAARPVYPEANPLPRTRSLFLSGYPGARYGPASPAEPTASAVTGAGSEARVRLGWPEP